VKTVKIQNFEEPVLAKNSGEIVLTLEGHRMKRCRLHCKRKIDPEHDHAIVETQDHLVALKNRKRFDANIPAGSWGVVSRFLTLWHPGGFGDFQKKNA